MDLQLIFYNRDEKRAQFELTGGIRPWDIFLAIKKGSFELVFPENGETYVIEPNEIAFIPANTEFLRTVKEPIDFHQFAFLGEPAHPFCRSLARGRLKIPRERVAYAISAIDCAVEMPDNRELMIHELQHIITENYLFGNSAEENSRGIGEDILEVIRYMSEHLCEELDIDALAAMVYLSHTGLIYKFRHQLGTTPSKYLIMLRQRRAKQLLLDGDLKINEIASRCGYGNAYYFTNAFRNYTGMSPTKFRRFYLDGNR